MLSINLNNLTRRTQKLEAALSSTAEPERLHPQRGYKACRKFPPMRPIQVRFGHLRRLPEAYRGERHVKIVKQLPDRDAKKWFQFAEVPGPDPNPKVGDGKFHCINVLFVKPYPQPER